MRSCDIKIQVRYSEVDPMGYLHHSRYLIYFEMGRTELLKRSGFTYRRMEQEGAFFVVVRIEARFRRSAHYDEVLTLTTRIDRMRRARIDHSYELAREGAILAEANSTIACVGRDGRPRLIPDALWLDQDKSA